jgi:hypothetical protein
LFCFCDVGGGLARKPGAITVAFTVGSTPRQRELFGRSERLNFGNPASDGPGAA